MEKMRRESLELGMRRTESGIGDNDLGQWYLISGSAEPVSRVSRAVSFRIGTDHGGCRVGFGAEYLIL